MLKQTTGSGHQVCRGNTGHIKLAVAGKAEQLLGQLSAALTGIEDVLQHALGA